MTTKQNKPRQPGEPSTNKPAPEPDTVPADKPAASSKTNKPAKE
jgi:hypothetical protein